MESNDADVDWSNAGTVGADVEAITADSDAWYVAAIRDSHNDGDSWDVVVDY